MGDYQEYQQIDYFQLLERLRENLKGRHDVEWEQYGERSYRVTKGGEEQTTTFPYYRLHSVGFRSSSNPIVIVTAGIHGEEQAGPLTLSLYSSHLFDYAKEKGVELIIYPCLNPSGFHLRTRYNADHEHPNNDFLRYLVSSPDGNNVWKDEVRLDEPILLFAHSHPSCSHRPFTSPLPFETSLLTSDLLSLPLHRVGGSIDIHQDYFDPLAHIPATYAYPYYHDLSSLSAVYSNIIQQVKSHAQLLSHTPIDSGYNTEIDDKGQVIGEVKVTGENVTDENGLIVRNDGCLAHLLFLMGSSYLSSCAPGSSSHPFQPDTFSVTVETTRSLPLSLCHRVNLCWVEGIILLVHSSSRHLPL